MLINYTISVGFLTNSVERSRVCKWWVGLEWASKGFLSRDGSQHVDSGAEQIFGVLGGQAGCWGMTIIPTW